MLRKLSLFLLVLTFSHLSYSSTINEPGFTETILAAITADSSQWGGVAVDSNGNVYAGAATQEVFKVTPQGAVSQFGTTGAGSSVLGLLVSGNTLFVGFTSGDIYTMDLTQGSPTGVFLTTLGSGSDAMGMAIAPTGFGAYAGQLVVGSEVGVFVVNPDDGAVAKLIGTPPSQLPHSDVAFTSDGILLATDYNGNRIVSISSTGAVSTFVSGLTDPEGIAIHPGTGNIYVALGDADQIIKVSPDGQTTSTFATGANFSGGWFMTGMRFSADGTTLTYLADSSPKLYQISGFSTVTIMEAAPVPALGPWSILMLLGLVGVFGFGWFKQRDSHRPIR